MEVLTLILICEDGFIKEFSTLKAVCDYCGFKYQTGQRHLYLKRIFKFKGKKHSLFIKQEMEGLL